MEQEAARTIIRQLGLLPLPREGGYFRETWRVRQAEGFVSSGGKEKSIATAIYYLLVPGQHSRLHRLPGPELYFHHAGAPLALLVLGEDQYPQGRQIILGSDLNKGQIPQFEVAGGAIQGSYPLGEPGWSLVSTVMAPGFEPPDFQETDPKDVCLKYPYFSDIIMRLGQ